MVCAMKCRKDVYQFLEIFVIYFSENDPRTPRFSKKTNKIMCVYFLGKKAIYISSVALLC